MTDNLLKIKFTVVVLNVFSIIFITPAITPYIILLSAFLEFRTNNFEEFSKYEIWYIVLMPLFTWYLTWCVSVINVSAVPLYVGSSDHLLESSLLILEEWNRINFPPFALKTLAIMNMFCSCFNVVVDLNAFNLVAWYLGRL